jgi:hypothetical protein
MGLGRVKTLPQATRWLWLSAFGDFDANRRDWRLRAIVGHLGRAIRQQVTLRSRYAPIAAMSGLTPTMFITRVRL